MECVLSLSSYFKNAFLEGEEEESNKKNFEFFDNFKTFQDKNLRREELKDI